MKALIERNYNRARQLLTDNMDILHAIKMLRKYETIDVPQIDDLMARRDVHRQRPKKPGASNNLAIMVVQRFLVR